MKEYQMKNAINSRLPRDIYVKKVEIVDENFHSRYNAKIKLIDFPEMNISSTEIRERIKAGKDIVDLVPKLEAQEIIQKGYFKSV